MEDRIKKLEQANDRLWRMVRKGISERATRIARERLDTEREYDVKWKIHCKKVRAAAFKAGMKYREVK